MGEMWYSSSQLNFADLHTGCGVPTLIEQLLRNSENDAPHRVPHHIQPAHPAYPTDTHLPRYPTP